VAVYDRRFFRGSNEKPAVISSRESYAPLLRLRAIALALRAELIRLGIVNPHACGYNLSPLPGFYQSPSAAFENFTLEREQNSRRAA
jgi:hypothetical protein